MIYNYELAVLEIYSLYCRVLKDIQEWKEAPIDCVVLGLYQLQCFFVNEIRRGLAGYGQYTLVLQSAAVTHFEQFLLKSNNCINPKDIIQKIKSGKQLMLASSIQEVIIR